MLNDFYTLFFQWLHFGCWQEYWLPFSLWLVAITVAGMYVAESTYWEMEIISLFFKIITLLSTMNARLMRTEEFIIIIIVIPQ